MNNDIKTIFTATVGIIVLALGLSLLFAFPVKWLWNYAVVGTITGVSPISFWKAWCLMILCHFLFKANVTVNER